MARPTIGLLHPGEMGAAIGADLVSHGHTVAWASDGRGPDTARRAQDAELVDAGSVNELMQRCEVVLSVCPPHAAVDVGQQVCGFTGTYLDANAVSPATAREIADRITAGGGRFVDGGIVGPPPHRPGSTRLYLSGAAAGEIGELFAGTSVETLLIGDHVGAASALKMAYAGWTKAGAALLLALRALARAEGVEEALLAEWSRSLPDLHERSVTAATSATTKGWRWVGEMHEIAASMAAAGLPAGFHTSAAEVFEHSPRTTDAPADKSTLDSVLNALLDDRATQDRHTGDPP